MSVLYNNNHDQNPKKRKYFDSVKVFSAVQRHCGAENEVYNMS